MFYFRIYKYYQYYGLAENNLDTVKKGIILFCLIGFTLRFK